MKLSFASGTSGACAPTRFSVLVRDEAAYKTLKFQRLPPILPLALQEDFACRSSPIRTMRLCESVPLRPAVARIKIHVKTRTGWQTGTLVLYLFLADALRLSPVFRKLGWTMKLSSPFPEIRWS